MGPGPGPYAGCQFVPPEPKGMAKDGGWWNSYPSGQGPQGICWKCGQVGHKGCECKVTGAVEGSGAPEGQNGDPPKEECSVEIGKIWNLGCVEKSGIEVRNSFGILLICRRRMKIKMRNVRMGMRTFQF